VSGPIDDLVDLMLELVPSGARQTLVDDPAQEVPRWYPPARTQVLALGDPLGVDRCSCDGTYDTDLLPGVPILIFGNDKSPRRARFTLLHELGHHLIRGVEPSLLDLIDDVAGDHGSPEALEERVCHAFAGRLLVSDEALTSVIGAGQVGPDTVVDLWERCGASWEATAIRAAQTMTGHGAVVIIRQRGVISFSASSPGLVSWWSRASPVKPGGPLETALEHPARDRAETFRYGLPGAEALWCESRVHHPGFAIAVLHDRPFHTKLNILDPEDREWDGGDCERCGGARVGDWCYECKSIRCVDCGVCGCWRRPPERLCEGPCGLILGQGAFDSGEDVCRDCLDI